MACYGSSNLPRSFFELGMYRNGVWVLCHDGSFERCFSISFVRCSKYAYDVFQMRDSQKIQLGRVCRCPGVFGWFFVSWIYPYVNCRGSTRVKAIRLSMNDYIVQASHRRVPLFGFCDCINHSD